ncbi:ABC transporter substrate-binding protein [Rhodocaloribacter litoris]|uniref:ABC transporter substrate binding protein n=1 Tax=Rhodocaloribacter litoris TaxID=2558931 RepID=UPI001E4ED77E|nr:ABC transporter substrate binding protein [Rhodocaloribacter litoris]QXD16057.1 ABC transporter substrate-binding protein [Rhodocaloribacter litoris]
MRMPHRIAVLSFVLALAGAATPVRLEDGPTPIQQMFVIKELKPDIERIGLIWDKNATDTEALMPQVQRASASTGIKVFLAEVTDLKDVAPQFRTLTREHQVQAIWILESTGVVDNSVTRSFIIKNATSANMPVFAPTEAWINEGASVAVLKKDGAISLLVNRAAAEAMSLTIPEKYLERIQYLAMN